MDLQLNNIAKESGLVGTPHALHDIFLKSPLERPRDNIKEEFYQKNKNEFSYQTDIVANVLSQERE